MSARKKPGSIRLYKRLLSQVWPYRAVFALAVFGMVVIAAADAAFVALLKPITDQGFVARDVDFITVMPLLLIGVFVLRGIGTFADTYGLTWVARKTIQDLRVRMFGRMVRMPAAWYDAHSSGSLVAKLIFHVEQVSGACTTAVRILIKDSLTVLFLLGWMAWLNLSLTAVFLLLAPPAVFVVRAAGRRFRNVSRAIQDSMGVITEISREAFNGQRLVKVYDGYAYESGRFTTAARRNTRLLLKHAAISSISLSLLLLVVGCGVAAVLVLVTWFSYFADFSAGSFTSYIVATGMLMAPMRRLANVNASVQSGLAGAESVFTVLDESTESDSGTVTGGGATAAAADATTVSSGGGVTFDKVNFAYPGRGAVLHDITFSVGAGETVALVGRTGSGKSTIVAMLLRLYQAGGGAIRIDGIDINRLSLRELRRRIALVSQDNVLFNLSIAGNITYGAAAAAVDRRRLEEVVCAARVDEFAGRLPAGLATNVGESGAQLSGGQRQRVSIARALYKNAPLLVLDEATSSLDTHSESLIQEAMDNLTKGRTTIVIAHRLSTVEHADNIIVLDHGRIIESGGHEALLAQNGAYAALHQARARTAGKAT